MEKVHETNNIQKKQSIKHNKRNGNKKQQKKNFAKKESRSDRELQEIQSLSEQINAFKNDTENPLPEYSKFDELPICRYTKRALKESNFVDLTEIQKKTILPSLLGEDIVGTAKTGSGKTLAFLIPLLECLYKERWSKEAGLGAIVISPTRELALQIFDVLRTVGKYHSFSAGLVIGGKDFSEEQVRIPTMNILVCTPGRILQHMEQSPLFSTDNVRMLVIDECDRCLDMGFKSALMDIVNNLNNDRQTLLYSATIDDNIQDLISACCHDPKHISTEQLDDYSTPKNLLQKYIVCDLDKKIEILYSFIRSHLKSKILVFMNACKEVRFLYECFRRMKPGIPLLELHGRQKQTMRTYIYYDFLQREHACLFCTDIAARGLDFPNIDWVIQYDAPPDAATYIHRVGRTARYKSKGNSLLMLCKSEEEGELKILAEKHIPLKRISVNPNKTQSVVKKVNEEVTKDNELMQLAQKAFTSYLRSIYLFHNTDIFDITQLDLGKFAQSLGLAVIPKLDLSTKKNKNKSWAVVQLEKEINEEMNKGKGNEHDEEDDDDEDDDDDDDLLVSVKHSKYNLDSINTSIANTLVIPKNPEKKRLKIKIDQAPSKNKIIFNDEGEAIHPQEIHLQDINEMKPIQSNDIEQHRETIKRRLAEGEEEAKSREQQRVYEKRLKRKMRKNIEVDNENYPVSDDLQDLSDDDERNNQEEIESSN